MQPQLQRTAAQALPLQPPALLRCQGGDRLQLEPLHQGGIQAQTTRLLERSWKPLQHLKHQGQVALGLRQAAAGQQAERLGHRRGGWLLAASRWWGSQGGIEEGVAEKPNRSAQLGCEIGGGEGVTAEHLPEPSAAQATAAGPGQPQPAFIVAGVGHQVGHHGPPAQPGGQHRDHITHDHHQVGLPAPPQEQAQPAKQVTRLTLNQFGQPSPKAGVPQPPRAEFTGAPQHREARLPVGGPVAHQGQGLNHHAAGLETIADQAAAQVLAVAIAEQQNALHAGGLRLGVPLTPAARSAPSPGRPNRACAAGHRRSNPAVRWPARVPLPTPAAPHRCARAPLWRRCPASPGRD